MTFTTFELFASGFRFAALPFSAGGRAAGFFFSGLDKSLVAGEINAAGLLAATLRLFTLRAFACISGSFDETFATLEVLTIGLWLAALALRTFRLSTRHRGSFDEASPTLEAGLTYI